MQQQKLNRNIIDTAAKLNRNILDRAAETKQKYSRYSSRN